MKCTRSIGLITMALFDKIRTILSKSNCFLQCKYCEDKAVTHARSWGPCRKEGRESGPHLTRQSARADHWALQENTAHEGTHCPKVVFHILFSFKIDSSFLKKYNY